MNLCTHLDAGIQVILTACCLCSREQDCRIWANRYVTDTT